MIALNSGKYVYPPFALGLILLTLQFFKFNLILFFVGLIIFGLGLFMAWFFRDPFRITKNDSNLIYAAADGNILYINQKQNHLKIAIRMSPFNVHINRYPISGNVVSIKHKAGLHKNVYFGDIENKNERTLTIINNEIINCQVLQLTGAFARRIETYCKSNDKVIQGNKMGMIRFGSQTNLSIMLTDKRKDLVVLCKLGDSVKAGITPMARIVDKK